MSRCEPLIWPNWGAPGRDLLREIAEHEETLTIELPNGKLITIQPLPDLEPLPELDGYVEEGWKDVIY